MAVYVTAEVPLRGATRSFDTPMLSLDQRRPHFLQCQGTMVHYSGLSYVLASNNGPTL